MKVIYKLKNFTESSSVNDPYKKNIKNFQSLLYSSLSLSSYYQPSPPLNSLQEMTRFSLILPNNSVTHCTQSCNIFSCFKLGSWLFSCAEAALRLVSFNNSPGAWRRRRRQIGRLSWAGATEVTILSCRFIKLSVLTGPYTEYIDNVLCLFGGVYGAIKKYDYGYGHYAGTCDIIYACSFIINAHCPNNNSN